MIRRLVPFVAVLAVLATALPAQADCLKCRVKGYVAALNAGDGDRALSYFSDEVLLISPDGEVTLDRGEARERLGWDFAMNTRVSFELLEYEGSIVQVALTEENDFFELLGVGARTYDVEFVFDNDLIQEIHLHPRPDTGSVKYDAALEGLVDWALVQHPGLLAEVYSEGRMVFSEETAETWRGLVAEFRDGC